MATKIYRLRKHLTDAKAEALKGKFLTEKNYDILIDANADGYDMDGKVLFRFRKNAMPLEVVKLGYESFKDSITLTEGRGIASGSSHKRVRKDGTVSNITVGNKVYSGNVGYMDASAMIHYCRKTAFAREYFEKFTQGIPFVQAIDKLYAELCPVHYKKQLNIAKGTNTNYRIGDTAFTTVTVNRNFQTAVHKDAGDYPEGFGNLCVYREGDWSGAYFCLPEYRVAINMQNTDILFVDVHKWHGNTPFIDLKEGDLRIAFVMYYREYMYQCKKPSEELQRVKQEENGYGTL
jgi:hypothetical protein